MTLKAASMIAVAGLLVLATAPIAKASYEVLNDNGSSITISDGQTGQVGGALAGKGTQQGDGVTAGAFNWDYNGADWLDQEWYDYRINNGPIQSISNLTTTAFTAPYNTDLNSFPDANATGIQMVDPGVFSITIAYSLVSNSDSDLSEQLTIKNLSTTQNLTMSLFEYNAWDLGGLEGPQTAKFQTPNTYEQTGVGTLYGNKVAAYYQITGPLRGFEHEAGDEDALYSCIANSNCTANGQLNNGIIGNALAQSYTGDPAWAFEWDLSLTPNTRGCTTCEASWSEDKIIGGAIPEPMPLILLGSVLVFIGRKLQVRILG